MREQLKTFGLVTFIAALIWIWAEGESVSSVVVNPRVAFAQDEGDLEIAADENWRATVRLRLEGSTVAIKQAERVLGGSLTLKPGQPGVPATPGDRQAVNLMEAMRALPQVRELGITVVDVDPPNTVVSVTRYVTREVSIRPVFPDEIQLLGEATVTPPKLLLRLPERLATRLTESDTATATVSAADLRTIRDDAPKSMAGVVSPPASLAGERGVEFPVDGVTVSFRVKRNVETVTVGSVPVWVSLPPTETALWDIEVTDKYLQDVTFTGPTDAIAAIRSRVPIAQVLLSSDDLERGVTSKEATITDLADGVEYTVTNRVVRLVVKKRENGGTGPNGAPSAVPEEGVRDKDAEMQDDRAIEPVLQK